MKDFYNIWIWSLTRALSGHSVSQAIRFTVEHRQTRVPTRAPVAPTAEFYGAPIHTRQWDAFVRQIGEAALHGEFPRVARNLIELLVPVAETAVTSADPPVRWDESLRMTP